MRISLLLLILLSHTIAASDTFIRFEQNGKVGLKSEDGTVVIPATFQGLGWSDGSFSVIGNITGYRMNQQWGIINLKKELITEALYESLVYAGGENIIVQKKINPAQSKKGCINLLGQEKIPFLYDDIQISGLRAIVITLKNGSYRYGLCDLEHREIIPSNYRTILSLGSLRYAVQNKEGKIALFNDQGNAITDFTIDSISGFDKNHAILYQNNRQGLINRDGTIVLEPRYHTIKIITIDKAMVRLSDEWLIITPKNEIIQRLEADRLIPIGDDFIVQQVASFGVVDRNLQIKIPTDYEQLISAGRLWIAKKNNRYGLLDEKGQEKIPFRYDSLLIADNQFRALTKNGWILIDETGKELSYKHYRTIESIFGRLIVNHKGYWGVLNDKGDEVIPCVYDSIVQFVSGNFIVKFKGLYGVINQREDWLVAPQRYPITLLHSDYYLLHTPDNVFLKKFNGEILYFTNNTFRPEKDFCIEVLPDGTEKTISYEGQIVRRVEVEGEIQKVFKESEGFTGIKRDGKFGFVDSRGRLRMANRYDSIQDFHEGMAAVKLIGRWGFIDTEDRVVINPNYDHVGRFNNSLAVATRNNKTGIINKEAKPVITFQYDSIQFLPSGNYSLYQNALMGLADKSAKILIEPRFNFLQEVDQEMVIVGRENRFGVNSINGMSIIPVDYAKLIFDKTKGVFLAIRKSEAKEVKLN